MLDPLYDEFIDKNEEFEDPFFLSTSIGINLILGAGGGGGIAITIVDALIARGALSVFGAAGIIIGLAATAYESCWTREG